MIYQINIRVAVTGLDYSEDSNILVAACCDNKSRFFNFPSLELQSVFFHQHSTYRCKASLVCKLFINNNNNILFTLF